MNSDGAKMPPEPPIPMVRLHAAILANASRIRNHSAYWPAVALSITGYPTPYICGIASSSSPSARPPTAGLAHSGRCFQARSHRSSVAYRTALNARPISAAITASPATSR